MAWNTIFLFRCLGAHTNGHCQEHCHTENGAPTTSYRTADNKTTTQTQPGRLLTCQEGPFQSAPYFPLDLANFYWAVVNLETVVLPNSIYFSFSMAISFQYRSTRKGENLSTGCKQDCGGDLMLPRKAVQIIFLDPRRRILYRRIWRLRYSRSATWIHLALTQWPRGTPDALPPAVKLSCLLKRCALRCGISRLRFAFNPSVW